MIVIEKVEGLSELKSIFCENRGFVRFRRLILRAGLPEPKWNVAVVTPSGRFVVDALWRSAGLVVEIDGALAPGPASWQRDLRRANALQLTAAA